MNINTTDSNIKLSYKGPFYIDILSNLGTYVRLMFQSHPLASNRLYKLFFELTQNVAKYSAEKSSIHSYKYSGIGSFFLADSEKKIILCTSNLIKSEDGPTLIKYCSEINDMDKNELRKYRSEKRRAQPAAKDTGAHIGIIQIGILTHNQIQYKVENLNDGHAVFTLTATIEKEDKLTTN